jgi:hypothetical protein
MDKGNWRRKRYTAHLAIHYPNEQADLDNDGTANRVDNITMGKRTAPGESGGSGGSAASNSSGSRKKGKFGQASLKPIVVGRRRQEDQDAKLSAWLITSGTSFKKSELLNPYFKAYVHSLDASSRILSQEGVRDYSIAERELLEMACSNEHKLIMEKYTYGNPYQQAMSDGVTVHGIKMLSEASCFVPAYPHPPMMLALNTTRCPNGDAQSQAADMSNTCEDLFGAAAEDTYASAIFDEGATSTGSALCLAEESCGLHVDSSMQKDMLGQNRLVNGKVSNDFPELTTLLGKCRDLGKFILRPKVWSAYEKKKKEMHEGGETRINFWRVVLDHCKTRIGAVLSLSESVILDRAMTGIMFNLWRTAAEAYPAPDHMADNLTDEEYTILEEVAYVMGIARPHQLFTQYEQWYTAALEILAQAQVHRGFQNVVDESGEGMVLDTVNITGEYSQTEPQF